MYFAYCKTEFNLSRRRLKRYAERLDTAQEHSGVVDESVLYPPFVIVCHDTRYKENSLTGLIRILGIGRFGEFSTFTFERVNNKLLGEIKRKKTDFTKDHVFAAHDGNKVVGVLRTYSATNPGKRSQKYHMDLISPRKDLGLDLARIESEAKVRYGVEAIHDAR
jgi:hypothetical protein